MEEICKDPVFRDHKYHPSFYVKNALFQVYKGVCQYCLIHKDFSSMVVEHIISRDKDKRKIMEVYKRFEMESDDFYKSRAWSLYPVGVFWTFLYPIIALETPRNSLFNYTLSCRSCNVSKGSRGDFLHLPHLMQLLEASKRNAPMIRKLLSVK